MSSDTLVKLESVGKKYPGRRLVWLLDKVGFHNIGEWNEVLKGCTFSIQRGESVGIMGRNGSGKSTLVQMIAGTTSFTAGSIHRNGRIGAMLDLTTGFRPELTGRQSIYLAGALAGLQRGKIDQLVPSIVEFSEVPDMLDRPLAHYSSGTWLRLAFAVQTFIDYDLLIVDEALQVGDIFFRQKCTTRIKELFSRGTALLLVSHDPSVLRELCTRGIVLSNNTIAFDGQIDEALRFYYRFSSKSGAPSHVGIAAKKGLQEYKILGVDIADPSGNAREMFMIGEEAVFRIRFTGGLELRQYRIILELKDRFGSSTTTLYSDRYCTELPEHQEATELVFSFKVKLDIEAGEYTYRASIGWAVRPNGTDITSASDWKGPFIVDWSYETMPAPFLGKFGITSLGYIEDKDKKSR